MIVPFKILASASHKLVSKRHKRNVYCTNRFGKDLAFYYALKTLTTTGHIQKWREQIADVKAITKYKSTQAIYTRLQRCEKLGLLKLHKTNISLTSFAKVAQMLRLKRIEYITYEYDISKPLQTPEYFLKLNVIDEAKNKRLHMAKEAISRNSSLKSILRIHKDEITENDVHQLQQLQVNSFKNGAEMFGLTTDEYKTVQAINADVELTAAAIKKLFRFKSWMTSCYLKVQLQARKLAKVNHRNVTSFSRMRKDSKLFHTGYDREHQNTFWTLPDAIISLAKTMDEGTNGESQKKGAGAPLPQNLKIVNHF